jgi:mRNA-degrading endonuclease RelE of RelBE toxin-antitoxin system
VDWDGLLRNRNGPTNIVYQFSSKTDVVFFTSVLVSLTKYKNYEIRRVAKRLRDKRSKEID